VSPRRSTLPVVGIVEHYVEGLVHVSSMADDYYRFDPQRFTLTGERRSNSYRLGQPLSVRLTAVSVAEARLDFELAEGGRLSASKG